MGKFKIKDIIAVIVLLVTVGAAWYFLQTNSQLLDALFSISWMQAAGLIILRILLLVVNGLFLRAFAAKYDVKLGWIEWFGLACVTAMGNFLTPLSGGLVARATYLKTRHHLAYSRFVTLLTANYLILFWAIGLVGLTISLPLLPQSQSVWLLILSFLTVVVVVTLLFFVPVVKFHADNRMTRLINTALEGWQLIKQDGRLLIELSIYTILTLLINGSMFWLAYTALGVSISPSAATLVSLLSLFAILVYITPGSLGIQEAIVSISSELLGAGVGQGLLVSLLIRAALVVVAFTLGPLFSFVLTRKITVRSSQHRLP